MQRRLHLTHLPTPIERRPALDELVGAEIWVKRDDATSGPEAGNKIRKLEFLLADAIDREAEVVITCGGIQSNHARATAVACARVGLRSVLYLRTSDPKNVPISGNVLLDRMVGAEIVLISPAEYRERNGIMEQARADLAQEGVPAYVVPEGGSNGLGSLGYVEAMREVRTQIDLGLCGPIGRFDVVAHACGSGGTAAGVALGSARFEVADRAWAFAVCDDRATFEAIIARIANELRGHDPTLPSSLDALVVDDRAKGPAYAVMDDAQKAFLVSVARKSGLILDPVYTGKALHGVKLAVDRGDIPRGARVLFLHTGGLPGLLSQGDDLAPFLGDAPAPAIRG
jgi:D-cysteine desulfhydrase